MVARLSDEEPGAISRPLGCVGGASIDRGRNRLWREKRYGKSNKYGKKVSRCFWVGLALYDCLGSAHIYSYEFSPQEIKNPVMNSILRNGWAVRFGMW